MAITIIRRKAPPVTPLEEVGLVEGYRPHPAFPPMLWPHFKVGEQVRIVAPSKTFFKEWKQGDTGTVIKVCSAAGMRDKHPESDLYFVELDLPRVAGKEIVYLTYKELACG